MHLARVQIKNFRNFDDLDVWLSKQVVIVGENRVGKSNFIFALRLVMDTSLADQARQLKLTDIWDGAQLADSPEVIIHLDFVDFDGDPALLTLLTDYRLATDYTTARLSYTFRKKAEITGIPQSESDYEFRVYGGGDESRSIKSDTRRRICLDVLHALRDAEGDLGSWRSSPLRPLLEDAISKVSAADLESISDLISQATASLGKLPPVQSLEAQLRTEIANLTGPKQDMRAKFGFAPTDPLRLFRAIGLYIDDGLRGISDASLGSANIALLALKLAEFAWRRLKNERNFTILCVEEPEAHLHPHMQRSIFQKLLADAPTEARSLFLTTHSPHIASVSPLTALVLLKSATNEGTRAFSLARMGLSADDEEDLQRYLDTTRAELLFSRGVIFVEGEAELALMPVFAQSCGLDLDELGISVCAVGGTHFGPYVRLAASLSLPFAVITDWDPLDGSGPPLGQERALDLIDHIRSVRGEPPLGPAKRAKAVEDPNKLREGLKARGIFVNASTFEIEVASSSLASSLLSILDDQPFGRIRKARLAAWRADASKIDPGQLLSMVADIGKGRLAARLAKKAIGLIPPAYIAEAIRSVATHV